MLNSAIQMSEAVTPILKATELVKQLFKAAAQLY